MMKLPVRRRILAAVVLACSGIVRAADPPATRHVAQGDRRDFHLRPVPPPVPALTYQLAVDPADRRPGSAAADYLQAAVLLTEDEQTHVDNAIEADDAGDDARFAKETDALFGDRRVPAILGRLDAAAGHDGGLDAAWHDAGLDTVLPQLNAMRALAQLARARGRQQARAGHPAEAVAALRDEYRLARAAADGSPLVCGLVGLAAEADATGGLAKLMDAADAPNLYWALATLPRPVVDYRTVIDGERRWLARANPVLGRPRGEPIAPTAWADMAANMQAMFDPTKRPPPPTEAERAAAAAEAKLYVLAHPAVVAYYARRQHVSPADAAKVDGSTLCSTYYVGRFQDASDEAFKWVGQPYPVLLPRWRAMPATLKAEGLADDNLFAIAWPSYGRSAEAFARADRELAALTAVEAVRSYAAAHDGRLPEHLADVTDTPAPDNPVTGRPFEWRVAADGVGTLADHSGALASAVDPTLLVDLPLEFTVRIRRLDGHP